MIQHIRIDNRLIHGQVAGTWVKTLGADVIIVCNDQVAADPIQKMALPLAARGQKVLVMSIADTAAYDQAHPDETKFVICKYPSDCLELLKKGVQVETINVGNAAPMPNTDFKMVTKSIAVTKEDAAIYREIAAMNGGHLETQMIPTYEKQDFLKLLDNNHL